MIPHFKPLDVSTKISQEQPCSSIRDNHTTFLVKNTLFKEEVAWQPLRKLQNCSPSILETNLATVETERAKKTNEANHVANYLLGHSNEVLFVFLSLLVFEKLRVMSESADFHYIKSILFDITLDFSTTYDGKKTNNTSFECPSQWFQNTKRTALQLFQGLSHNLSFKKCIFYWKGYVTAPEKAAKLFS